MKFSFFFDLSGAVVQYTDLDFNLFSIKSKINQMHRSGDRRMLIYKINNLIDIRDRKKKLETRFKILLAAKS